MHDTRHAADAIIMAVEMAAALRAMRGRRAPSSLVTLVDRAAEKPKPGMKTMTSTWKAMPTAEMATSGLGCGGVGQLGCRV